MLNVSSLSVEDVRTLYENLSTFSLPEQTQILAIVEELERRNHAKQCQISLIDFCQHIDPNYIVATHHKKLAELLMEIAFGQKDRVAVSIPPRHGKSHLISTLFPAWFLGKYPDKSVLMASHTGDLAVDFGRKVRNIVSSQAYKEIFPGVTLAADSKSAGRWSTNSGGSYYSCGVGASIAGRGADLLLCVNGNTLVTSKRGVIPAEEVVIGDYLLGHKGFGVVTKKFWSSHKEEIVLAGARLSRDHPVWTFNRGWIVADLLTSHDLLDTMGFHQRIGAYYEQFKTAARRVFFPHLQHLGDDAPTMQQPKCSKLHYIRGAGCKVLRTVGRLQKFLRGYGTPTCSKYDTGQKGQQRGLHSVELSMGGYGNTAEQPTQYSEHHRFRGDSISSAMGAENQTFTGPNSTSDIFDGDEPRSSYENRKNELGAAPRTVSEFGWVKRTAFRLYSHCCKKDERETGIIVGSVETFFASYLCGLLLGVRTAKGVKRVVCSQPNFVNFTVEGTNTFYAGQWMTHNCDDPHSEQDLLNGNFDALEKTYQWFTTGARTRLMSGGRIAVVHTRWHMDDLIGHLVKDGSTNEDADQYEVFEFPAILDTASGPKALWPEKFDLDALKRTKASMPAYQWNAQYMQTPTAEEAAIIKREWWKPWTKEDPPRCDYVIMTLDAAAEAHNRADFTALATWGVFSDDRLTGGASHLILLNVINVRLEFPELKDLALKEYKDWEPDALIVEKKSAGTQLYQELRRMGIPVQEFTPSKSTGDKIARVNAVADILRSGMVWYPEGRRWAEELIEQCVSFPYGSHDDMVDVTSMALARFRQGGFISLPSDLPDEVQYFKSSRRAAYY